MRHQDVFKKIGNILQELNEQYEYLKTQGDSIDDLELELFAANSHFLSDHLEVLRKLNATLAKSLPAHGQNMAIETPEPEITTEPDFQFSKPKAIVEPAVAFVEETAEQEPDRPEPAIELPASFANEVAEPEIEAEATPTLAEYFHVATPETKTEEQAVEAEPTLAEYYHIETPEEEPEAAPEPGGGFHFDFETAPQPQEDADEYTSKQFQFQPQADELEPEETPTIDEETAEVIDAETEYKEEEPKTGSYSFQVRLTPPPMPTGTTYQHEETLGESETPEPKHEEPVTAFEPQTAPLEIADEHTQEIEIKPDTGHDMFSFMRTTEPETTRDELTLGEAGEDETGSINAAYHAEQEEPTAPTVAEAMASTVTPEPEAVPYSPQFTPEPAAIPTYQLKQQPISAPAPTPVIEPERQLTLNERLSANTAINATAASVQPIKDLKSAITLNDKMLFVRDLFNGYSLAYSEAIEILNRFNNFEDAERFLNTNYVEKNRWAEKPTTNEKFFDLLRRRFS